MLERNYEWCVRHDDTDECTTCIFAEKVHLSNAAAVQN